MKTSDKELYRKLRDCSWAELWEHEVPHFNQASPSARKNQVALIRAVGVVFSESGDRTQIEAVRDWLFGLLKDDDEKIRRYAIAALPKTGVGAAAEAEFLALWRRTTSERERKALAEALGKIGGAATLQELAGDKAFSGAEQKVKASVARAEGHGSVLFDASVRNSKISIHLHCRAGLEEILKAEVIERGGSKFEVKGTRTGLVILAARREFSIADVYKFRCFSTLGFSIGSCSVGKTGALAALIASPLAREAFKAFNRGPVRYRIEFASKGHQRAAVRDLANQVYARFPELLNSGSGGAWTVVVYTTRNENWVELVPKILPDPRFDYRRRDVPAASHPPLAATMARLAGAHEGDVIWDPFCGSGLELIERGLLGGVAKIYGTDRSAEAIGITRANLEAAQLGGISTELLNIDFRDFIEKSASLIITNPPMGKRVPVPSLRALIEDLFTVAARTLKCGGRLVLVNPLEIQPSPRLFRCEFRKSIDMGGFRARLEKHVAL